MKNAYQDTNIGSTIGGKYGKGFAKDSKNDNIHVKVVDPNRPVR